MTQLPSPSTDQLAPPLQPMQLPAKIKQIAQFAVASPLVAWGIMMFLGDDVRSSRWAALALGLVFVSMTVAGLIASIVALGLVRKYGRKGLLGWGLSGLLLNILMIMLFGIGIAAVLGKAKEARRDVLTAQQAADLPLLTPGAQVLYDESYRYRLEVPPGFTHSPKAAENKQFVHMFELPMQDQSIALLTVEHLPGRISRDRVTPQILEKMATKLPAGSQVLQVRELHWQGIALDAIDMLIQYPDELLLVSMVQVPLLPRAIQIGVIGVPQNEETLRAIQAQTLHSVVGKHK